MAVDEASANGETAESAIARVAQAVAQPGGMDIDWKRCRRLAPLSPAYP